MKNLFNILLYQCIWIFSIFWGNIGACFGIALLLLHLTISKKRQADLRIMGSLLLIGLIVDGTLSQLNFFIFTTPGTPIPFWLSVIWLGLAITPHHSLSWMKHKPLLSIFFGAIGGPLAYWAGVRLGAATFTNELLPSLAILACIWAIIWPLTMHFSVISGKCVIR